ncbi:MAG: hydantoinase/oxoprolinase family protein [Planctomycetaceae bacterium]
MRVIGLDIGGANVKAADGDGTALSRPFPLWKEPERLTSVLDEVLARFAPADALAVTMTAELADCFATKAEGVAAVLRSVEAAAGGKPIHVWRTGGEFVSPEAARELPLLVAAANWHALATWAGRIAPRGGAILIDIGTTTADLIPLFDGTPTPRGSTDVERLQAGELVYSGVRRTPVCAIAHSAPFRDRHCPLAAELFATTLDAYLLTGDVPENEGDRDTANGRPATIDRAHDRLARMLCCDRTEIGDDELLEIARFVADVQRQRIAGALARVLAGRKGECRHVILSGSGTFLAERVAASVPSLCGVARTKLADLLAPEAATAACAFAVARLAAERGT